MDFDERNVAVENLRHSLQKYQIGRDEDRAELKRLQGTVKTVRLSIELWERKIAGTEEAIRILETHER